MAPVLFKEMTIFDRLRGSSTKSNSSKLSQTASKYKKKKPILHCKINLFNEPSKITHKQSGINTAYGANTEQNPEAASHERASIVTNLNKE